MSTGFLERLGAAFGGNGDSNNNGNNNGNNSDNQNQGQNNGNTNGANFTGINSDSSNGGNGGNGNNGQNNDGNNGGNSDPYADLFSNLPEPTTPKPLFDPIDPKQMSEFANKQNFLAGIDRNLLAQVEKGGQEGTRAMLQLMQQVAANSFSAATKSSLNLIEDGTKRSADALRGELPTHLRNEASRNALNQELMNDPAVSPVVESIRSVIAQKFPNKHPSEIASMTEGYFQMLAGKFGGQDNGGSNGKPNGQKSQNDAVDWESFYLN